MLDKLGHQNAQVGQDAATAEQAREPATAGDGVTLPEDLQEEQVQDENSRQGETGGDAQQQGAQESAGPSDNAAEAADNTDAVINNIIRRQFPQVVHTNRELPAARLLTCEEYRQQQQEREAAKLCAKEEQKEKKEGRARKKAERDMEMQNKRAERQAKTNAARLLKAAQVADREAKKKAKEEANQLPWPLRHREKTAARPRVGGTAQHLGRHHGGGRRCQH